MFYTDGVYISIKYILEIYFFKYLKFIYYCLFYVYDNLGLWMEEASWIKGKTPVMSHMPNAEMFQRK